MMKLYWAPGTRSLRTLWMLEEAGVPYERIHVDIRNGAKLGLELPSSSINDPPQRTVWFDLSPTHYVDQSGHTVWETAEELDPMHTMAWLCGGYWAPGVRDVMYGTIPPTSPINPGAWNHYVVKVLNQDGTVGTAATLQSLSIADAR